MDEESVKSSEKNGEMGEQIKKRKGKKVGIKPRQFPAPRMNTNMLISAFAPSWETIKNMSKDRHPLTFMIENLKVN